MANFALTDAQVAYLEVITDDDSDNYVAGYDYINSIVQGNLSSFDSDTAFWYQNAPLINDPTGDAASRFYIRDVTAYGLRLDGYVGFDLQQISDAIANTVIGDVIQSSSIPDISTLVTDDISTTIQNFNVTIGGWGGSYYYWSQSYTSGTVGTAIGTANPEYWKFIAVNGAALADTTAAYTNATIQGILNYATGNGASVPIGTALVVASRAATLATYGGSITGDPEIVNGYTHAVDANGNSVWYTTPDTTASPGDFSLLPLPTYANPSLQSQLDAESAYRSAHQSITAGSNAPLLSQHAEINLQSDGQYSVTSLDTDTAINYDQNVLGIIEFGESPTTYDTATTTYKIASGEPYYSMTFSADQNNASDADNSPGTSYADTGVFYLDGKQAMKAMFTTFGDNTEVPAQYRSGLSCVIGYNDDGQNSMSFLEQIYHDDDAGTNSLLDVTAFNSDGTFTTVTFDQPSTDDAIASESTWDQRFYDSSGQVTNETSWGWNQGDYIAPTLPASVPTSGSEIASLWDAYYSGALNGSLS